MDTGVDILLVLPACRPEHETQILIHITVGEQLEVLEDGENVDYTGVVMGYRNAVRILEERRETLQRRGRTL